MQTLIIDSLKSPLLLVWGLPEGTINPVATMGYLTAKVPNEANYCHVDVMSDPIKLQKFLDTHKAEDDYKQSVWKIPDGEWKLIGKLSELTEEQAKELVSEIEISDVNYGYEKYMSDEEFARSDYVNACATALESFRSAIESELPAKLMSEDEFLTVDKARSQSKTLPANTLIFKKS